MKTLASLHDILTTYLNDLYNSEILVEKVLIKHLAITKSENLKKELLDYFSSINDKMKHITEINKSVKYQADSDKNLIIKSILEESNFLISSIPDDHLKDVIILNNIQLIIHHKIGRLRICRAISNQLGLHSIHHKLSALQEEEEASREMFRWLGNKELYKEAQSALDINT